MRCAIDTALTSQSRVAPLMLRADQVSDLMCKRVVGHRTGVMHNRKGLLRVCTYTRRKSAALGVIYDKGVCAPLWGLE